MAEIPEVPPFPGFLESSAKLRWEAQVATVAGSLGRLPQADTVLSCRSGGAWVEASVDPASEAGGMTTGHEITLNLQTWSCVAVLFLSEYLSQE